MVIEPFEDAIACYHTLVMHCMQPLSDSTGFTLLAQEHAGTIPSIYSEHCQLCMQHVLIAVSLFYSA